MKIKKMTATFGKLKNTTLDLEPGLNIIEAPNEHGKSTWCGFIKAMLYGIDTSERDRAGFLSAKTRFRPWDGGAMVGTMDISHEGRDITVQRTTKGASYMKNFIAVYTGTAEFLRSMNSENAGEELTGVSRQVFERTAFIRRPDIRVSQTSELEKRISAMVSSGDENVSFSDADALLRSWSRKLRHNKTGSIPALEKELKDAREQLALIESSSQETANLKNNMARLEKQIELMENDLEVHKKLERRAAARRLEEARKNAEKAAKNVEELTAAITKNGHKITREDIKDIRETASAVVPLRAVATDAEKSLWQAEKELSDTAAKKKASPLFGRSEESIKEDIEAIRVLEEKVKNTKERKKTRILPIALTVIGIIALAVTSGFLSPFGEWVPAISAIVKLNIPGLILSAIILIGGIALFFIKPPQRRTAADELSELLSKYNVSSSDKLSSALAAFSAISREEDEKRATRDSARMTYEKASAAAQEAGAKSVEQLSVFIPGVTSGEEVIEALNETEKLIDRLTHAEFDAVSSRNVYETLLAEFDDTEEIDDTYLPVPIRNYEDTLAAIERAKVQLSDATRAYDLATGARRTLGDPALIEGEIQTLTERIAEENRRYNALAIAVDALSQANLDLQTRFSPLISKKAGEIMNRLTSGRYEKLVFDKGFDAGAKEVGDPASRNVLSLSDGTADEVYLSLRLAMCELILDGDDPCPIILDDALANFDDVRCGLALEVLREISKTRQVILFTCHSREKALLSGKDGVNVVEF